MSDPLALATRLFDEVFSTGNLEHLDELVSPHFLEHQFESAEHPARVTGPEGIGQMVRRLRTGAEDLHYEIEDSVVKDDTVWLRLRATGTDTGGQLGFAATGQRFSITVIDILRAEDGQLVEHWGVPDRLGLLQQLGHVRPPSRPA